MATVGKVGLTEKIAFGCGDVGCVFVWTVIGSFFTIYLTDSVGITAAAVSGILLSVRIMDGFSDLVMGYILDRTNSKLGKARPWILWTAPFYGFVLNPLLCRTVILRTYG